MVRRRFVGVYSSFDIYICCSSIVLNFFLFSLQSSVLQRVATVMIVFREATTYHRETDETSLFFKHESPFYCPPLPHDGGEEEAGNPSEGHRGKAKESGQTRGRGVLSGVPWEEF